MQRNFINLADFTGEQLTGLLRRARDDKAAFRAGKLPASLPGRTLAMIFEKPSLRTRVSFEAAMTQLGGAAINLAPADIGLGKREPVRDVARVLGRMCDAIMARVFAHSLLEEMAAYAGVPVLNALSDFSHPCQALADLLTVQEHRGELAGKTLAFVGDGNNVARSLAVACCRLGMHFVLTAPAGYELDEATVDTAGPGSFRQTPEAPDAVEAADVIYTDTWVSMGQEAQRARRVRDFQHHQVSAALLAAAPKDAMVLHCLPAYRGYEITDEAFEAHAQEIFDQAENRLHAQRTLLNVLIGEGGIP